MRYVALSALLLTLSVTTPAVAQDDGSIGDVSGPGQAVAQPPAHCPRTIGCTYAEQNMLPDGYRLQSLQICGANCTTQYWIAAMSDGHQLLELDPVRGGAIMAVSRTMPPDGHAQVRIIMPNYAQTDPACCPSAYSDTLYSWDPDSDTLVAADASLTPADQFAGYDATRQELLTEGWIVGNV